MGYIISEASSMVRDKKGRIRFAGTDTEAIQWAIDKIDANNKKWYNRLRRWLGFGSISVVNLDAAVYELTETINLVADNVDLRGSEQKEENNQ